MRSKPKGIRSGLIVVSPERIIIEKSLRLGFSATNNEAVYEALMVGMAMVQKMGVRTVEIFSRFKVGCRPSKGRTGSQGCENARILEPSEALTIRI